MNYKSNGKYFTQKNYLLYVGIGVVGIGVIFLILGWWWMMAAGIAVIGLALIFVSREGLVKGEDVDK